MSEAWQYYVITLLVLYGVNLIAVWSLNFQFGVAGVMNFAFIIFQAIGAYIGAVLTLGPAEESGWYQSYILGMDLVYPLPLLLAAAAGALLALVLGIIALRPPHAEYQALVMIVVSAALLLLVSSQKEWFNGTSGIAGVPRPLSEGLGAGTTAYGWFYVAFTAAVCTLVYLIMHRMTRAPWGRRLRAMRDDPIAASALGVNVRKEQMVVLMLSGSFAALSGAILVQFVGAWSTANWTLTATFLYFTALIVGGAGNYAGAALGVALIWTVLVEAVRYLPTFGRVGLSDMLGNVLIGVLTIAFLWFRPQGLIPERRRRLRFAEPTPADNVASSLPSGAAR